MNQPLKPAQNVLAKKKVIIHNKTTAKAFAEQWMFYRDAYFGLVKLVPRLIVALVLALMVAALEGFFLFYKNVTYFATDDHGSVTKIEPVDLPLDDAKIRQFVADAMSCVNNLNYSDYEMRLEACRPYFTEGGYVTYRKALIEGGIIETLQVEQSAYRSIVESVGVSRTTVIQAGALGNRFAWQTKPIVLRNVVNRTGKEVTKRIPFIVSVIRMNAAERGRQLAVHTVYQGQEMPVQVQAQR